MGTSVGQCCPLYILLTYMIRDVITDILSCALPSSLKTDRALVRLGGRLFAGQRLEQPPGRLP